MLNTAPLSLCAAKTALCWEFPRFSHRKCSIGLRRERDGGCDPLSGKSILTAYRMESPLIRQGSTDFLRYFWEEERRTSIRSCRSVFVRPAEPLLGVADTALSSAVCVAPLRPRGTPPCVALRLSHYVGASLFPCWSCEAWSHALGVFDWTQSDQSGAWSSPNQRFGISKRLSPKHCWPALIVLA